MSHLAARKGALGEMRIDGFGWGDFSEEAPSVVASQRAPPPKPAPPQVQDEPPAREASQKCDAYYPRQPAESQGYSQASWGGAAAAAQDAVCESRRSAPPAGARNDSETRTRNESEETAGFELQRPVFPRRMPWEQRPPASQDSGEKKHDSAAAEQPGKKSSKGRKKWKNLDIGFDKALLPSCISTVEIARGARHSHDDAEDRSASERGERNRHDHGREEGRSGEKRDGHPEARQRDDFADRPNRSAERMDGGALGWGEQAPSASPPRQPSARVPHAEEAPKDGPGYARTAEREPFSRAPRRKEGEGRDYNRASEPAGLRLDLSLGWAEAEGKSDGSEDGETDPSAPYEPVHHYIDLEPAAQPPRAQPRAHPSREAEPAARFDARRYDARFPPGSETATERTSTVSQPTDRHHEPPAVGAARQIQCPFCYNHFDAAQLPSL